VNGMALLNWMALVFMLVAPSGCLRVIRTRGWFLACVAFAWFFNWLPFLCERGDLTSMLRC